MGIQVIYRTPRSLHPAYSYLLDKLPVNWPNQLSLKEVLSIPFGAMGQMGPWILPYNPMKRGFVYLAAVIDWFTRRVLSWRLSITLEVDFCIEAVEEALARYGKPDIFNTDQGSQFTSIAFTQVLKDAEIAISMDGRGAWRDNVFVERLWRTIKYEEVYLHAYNTVPGARAAIGKYLIFYNTKRPHSSLDGQTPDQAYFNAQSPIPAAA